MKKLLFILLISFFWKISNCQLIIGTVDERFPPISWAGKTTVIVGDSWVLGIAASDNAHRWSTLFCGLKGTTESNLGISGETMQTNVCGNPTFDKTTVPTYNPSTHAALIICLGLNDVGLNNGTYDTATYRTTYNDAVSYFRISRGWPNTKIILVSPGWAASYNDWIGSCSVLSAASVARQNGYNVATQKVAHDYVVQYVDMYTPLKANLTSADYNSGGAHMINSGMSYYATTLSSLIN